MKVQRGDVVFSQKGRPGVVEDRNETTGKLTVENQGDKYQEARKLGFINGVPEANREKFSAILREIGTLNEPMEKIMAIGKHIEELEKDPKNLRLVHYLEAQKAHVMYSEGVQPRTYQIDEMKLNMA